MLPKWGPHTPLAVHCFAFVFAIVCDVPCVFDLGRVQDPRSSPWQRSKILDVAKMQDLGRGQDPISWPRPRSTISDLGRGQDPRSKVQDLGHGQSGGGGGEGGGHPPSFFVAGPFVFDHIIVYKE